jgi:hypothetical protein
MTWTFIGPPRKSQGTHASSPEFHPSPKLGAELDYRRLFEREVSTLTDREPETCARVLDVAGDGVEFHFNYASDQTRPWNDEGLRQDHRFRTFHPAAEEGLKASL